jgi:DnaJ-class molecular chaperone
MRSAICAVTTGILATSPHTAAFLLPTPWHGHSSKVFPAVQHSDFALSAHRTEKTKPSFLLKDFCVASGEVINPYRILKVPRKATRDEIRAAYVTLSRRYHPDGFRQRTHILPGACNNVDEVRDQWERIKLSYEILSNAKTRKNYDRREALADPAAAVHRAAVNAAVNSLTGMGKSLFHVGSLAVNSIASVAKKDGESRLQETNDNAHANQPMSTSGTVTAEMLNCTAY